MSRPTAQLSAYRTSIAASAGSNTSARGAPSRRSGASSAAAASGGSGSSSPVTVQLLSGSWSAAEEVVPDTWSGYLGSQLAARLETGSRAPDTQRQGRQQRVSVTPGTAYLSCANLLTALSACVARQNETLEQVRASTVKQRREENAEHVQERAAAEAGPTAEVENTLIATVLRRMLASSQERWQTLLTRRIDAAVAHEEAAAARAERKQHRERAKRGLAKPLAAAARGSSSPEPAPASGETTEAETPPPPPPALPSHDELLSILVDGVNDRATQDWAMNELDLTVDAGGLSPAGLLTVFETHVQALLCSYPALAPGRAALRSAFAELHPHGLSAASNPVATLDTSLGSAEAQLDQLLRHGDQTDVVARMLLATVHPAMRRLVYPVAFGLPLRVTDGKPPFPAEGDATINGASPSTIPAFLTCASRHSRDKLRRRYQHSFSTPLQSARCRALQGMTERDVRVYVGDSDRYFIYQDEVSLVATAMVADRGVPVTGMRAALEQLGRDGEVLDAYVVYLHSEEDGLVRQRAPPCGFFPVAGASSLIAPLGNVTGDSVEQYALAAAMFAQLWGRLQGPTPELLQCCLIFERLVTEVALPATLHATRVLQCPPLRLALGWMLTGFADVLEPLELLNLWDWLAAYHMREMHGRSSLSRPVGLAATTTGDGEEMGSGGDVGGFAASAAGEGTAETPPCALWLLPVMAASLFAFRAPLVLQCRSRMDMEALFVANPHVLCRPLLQAFLFTDALR